MEGSFSVSILNRALRSIQRHPFTTMIVSFLYFIYFLFLVGLSLVEVQLSFSSSQLESIMQTMQNQESASETGQIEALTKLMSQIQQQTHYWLLLALLMGTFFFAILQVLLFSLRKKEFRNLLLLGEHKLKLTSQLVLEQLVLVNSILLFFITFYAFFNSTLLNQVSDIESSLVQRAGEELASMDSNSSDSTPVDAVQNDGNITRFNVKGFILSTSMGHERVQSTWERLAMTIAFANLFVILVVSIPNVLLLHFKKNVLSYH